MGKEKQPEVWTIEAFLGQFILGKLIWKGIPLKQFVPTYPLVILPVSPLL